MVTVVTFTGAAATAPVPAILVVDDLDLMSNRLLQARLETLSTAPTGMGAGDVGRVWFGSDFSLNVWNGTTTTIFAAGGGAATLVSALISWANSEAFEVSGVTRDSNGAVTTASVTWPDGGTGTFTTDTASSAFPGAIDAYHVTYSKSGTSKTVTQSAVTRDSNGAVTTQPVLVVT